MKMKNKIFKSITSILDKIYNIFGDVQACLATYAPYCGLN